MNQKNTNLATLFSKDLARQLDELSARGALAGYGWTINGHLPGRHRECVDVVGAKDGGRLIFVEAEIRRGNPESNVAKIWKWAQGQKDSPPFILIQGFSKYYGTSSPKVHRETAEFFGEQMERQLGSECACYVAVTIDYMPRAESQVHRKPGGVIRGAGRRTRHAYELAERVRREVGRSPAKPRAKVAGAPRV